MNAGFEPLLAAVETCRDDGVTRIERLLSGSAPLAVAAAWSATAPGTVVFLAGDGARLLPAAADLEVLLRAMGLSRPVFRLPGLSVNPYGGVAPHAEAVALRVVALTALAANRPGIVVASAAGAMARTAAPDRLLDARIPLEVGSEASLSGLSRRLADAGYRREDPASTPGDFAVRGGIVDVFPVDRESPVRIEFAYDRIEEMRGFDPASQRSAPGSERPEALVIPPAREWIGAAEPEEARPGAEEFRAGLGAYLSRDASALVEDPDAFGESAEAEWSRLVRARRSAAGETRRDVRLPEAASFALRPDELQEALRRSGAVELAGIASPSRLVPEDAGEPDPATDEAPDPGARVAEIPARAAPSLTGGVSGFLKRLREPVQPGGVVHVFVPGESAAERFRGHALAEGVPVAGPSDPAASPADDPSERRAKAPPRVFVHAGRLAAGFEMPGLGIEFAGAAGLAPAAAPPPPKKRRSGVRMFLSDFRDLRPGDPVVHADHGVGRFRGVARLDGKPDGPELVHLEYAGGDRLYVPVDRLDLLEKYTAGPGATGVPRIDRLGGTRWAQTKKRVVRAMRDMADELIRLYAERRRASGHAFDRTAPGQSEFEAGFEWTETPDQARAIREVFADMEAEAPMDRLLVGDVGFGKTEVALRATFKAAMTGKQVALLVPTTVLAAQHWRLFRERFREFPVRIEGLSRFRTRKERSQVVAGLRDGSVDVVIGTHRLLSRDVDFHDLGLLIVDEEQRFGVAAKERLKRIATRVDHLAMTATPIPRTLHMSLSGIRDMSVIETAPQNRMAIQTHVIPFHGDRIAEAIRRELERNGQVYFVHNRIASIPAMQGVLERICPEARVLTAHGKMTDARLEKTLLRFQDGEADILLTTTIIENGLDLPRVNTLIVNRADSFGLAQLYQIRGRVGRSARRAYAFLLAPPGPVSSGSAQRLAALREFSELGAGFRIAALDMELRGAGNLLGASQHGHIEAVGFDLYCRLLDEAVADAQGVGAAPRCAMNLRFRTSVPEGYVPDARDRMWLYKRCASVSDGEGLSRLREDVRDRYGTLPKGVSRLFEHVRLRLLAESLGYASVRREGNTVWLEAGGHQSAARSFRTPLADGVGPDGVLKSVERALEAARAARAMAAPGAGGDASSEEPPQNSQAESAP